MGTPVTLILGLGRDVGTACARRFQEDGHNVLVAAPTEQAISQARERLGPDLTYHQGDLHNQIGIRNVLTAALEAYGRHDNLIVTPPIAAPQTLSDLDLQNLDKVMGETVNAAALTLSLFSKAITEQPPLGNDGLERRHQTGTVTFVLGLAAKLYNPGKFTEAVTQNGVLGVVRAGALELAHKRIRVNAIAALRPRVENTETWLKTRTPLGRPSLADEIADAAAYLASPHSAIITGETLTLDGGRSQLGGTLGSAEIPD